MLNFERFDAGNVEKPNRHTLTPHTDNHALESGSSMDPTPSERTPAPIIVQHGKFQETMKNHASKCLLVKRCANFDEQRSMLIHHDQSIPNLVSSNYVKFRNFQENTKKFFSLDYQHAAST